MPSKVQTFIRVVPSQHNPGHAVIEKAYREDVPAFNTIAVRWEDIPDLITKLRRAHTQHHAAVEKAQLDADGTVAAVLLQTHNAAAPGDLF
jgi:hypothetical protein